MSVQPKVAEVRPSKLAAARVGGEAGEVHGIDPAVLREVLAVLPGAGSVCVARAPRRLEVMGGSAAFMGSLVLTMPLAEHVTVAARLRQDGQLSIVLAGSAERNGDAPMHVPLSALATEDANGKATFRGVGTAPVDADIASAVFCALSEAERSGLALRKTGGLAIAISRPDLQRGAASDLLGTVVAASLAAAASASGGELPTGMCHGAARRLPEEAQRRFVSAEDISCPLYGAADAVNLHRPDPNSQNEAVLIPESLCLVGVDSGAWSDDRLTKCVRYRTATYMGRFLTDRMIRHEGVDGWNGMLAHLSVDDYVHRYRDRIPTKMKGREFLDRFGDVDAAGASVEPGETYKLRSRTEHPIYEHARAGAFADALRRFARTRDPAVLEEAGELMYASHWSYGQRCGLGSVETDLLVNLIRRHGETAGVVGAKITGIGGGGVVCVLMKQSDAADAALDEAVREYAQRTGLSARVLRGSLAGALVSGVTRVTTS